MQPMYPPSYPSYTPLTSYNTTRKRRADEEQTTPKQPRMDANPVFNYGMYQMTPSPYMGQYTSCQTPLSYMPNQMDACPNQSDPMLQCPPGMMPQAISMPQAIPQNLHETITMPQATPLMPQAFSQNLNVYHSDTFLTPPSNQKVLVPPTAVKVMPETVFMELPDRLGLMKSGTVKVTVGELRRRMGQPELYDLPMIMSLLRKPRSQVGAVTKKLREFGLPVETRTPADASCDGRKLLKNLLEDEACQMARDFSRLVVNGMDVAMMTASAFQWAIQANPGKSICKEVDEMRRILLSVRDHLSCCGLEPSDMDRRSHPMASSTAFNNDFLYTPEQTRTHGFGPTTAVAIIDLLVSMISPLEKSVPCTAELEKPFMPIPGGALDPEMSYSNMSIDSGLGISPTTSPSSHLTPATTQQPLPLYGVAFGSSHSPSASDSSVDPSLFHAVPCDGGLYDHPVMPRLLMEERAIEMTYGEMKRRVVGPERLHASMLCAYIRKAKGKQAYAVIRQHLSEHGIEVKTGARKAMQNSSWTSLSEAEARTIWFEASRELDMVVLTDKITEYMREHLDATRVLKSILDGMYWTCRNVGEDPTQPSVKTVLDEHILRFGLMTHHFGHPMMATVCRWLYGMIAVAIKE